MMYGFDTRTVRLQADFKLVNVWPKFTSDVDEARGGVIGDPVKHFGAGEFVAGFGGDGSQVESADDFAGAGIDLEDVVRLPLIGIEIAMDQLKLVDVAYRTVVVVHREGLDDLKGRRVEIGDIAGAVAHDEVCSVGRHAPAFARGEGEFAQFFEGCGVVDKAHFCLVGQLIDFTVEKGNSLPKVFFPVDLHFGEKLAGDGIYGSKLRSAALGHVGVSAGAFVELAVVK